MRWQLFQAEAKRKRKAPILEKQSKFKAEEERKANLVSESKRIRDEEALELREQRRRSVACIEKNADALLDLNNHLKRIADSVPKENQENGLLNAYVTPPDRVLDLTQFEAKLKENFAELSNTVHEYAKQSVELNKKYDGLEQSTAEILRILREKN